MKAFIYSLLIAAIFSSCSSEKDESDYDKKLSRRLLKLIDATESENNSEALSVLEEMDDDKRFVHSFKLNIKDQDILKTATDLCTDGDYQSAKDLINKRISQRGLTPTLEKALLTVETAAEIISFDERMEAMEKTLAGDLIDQDLAFVDSIDARRQWATIMRDGNTCFKGENDFKEWGSKNLARINTAQKKEKQLTVQSLSLHRDIAYVSDPLAYVAADLQLQFIEPQHQAVLSQKDFLNGVKKSSADSFYDDIPYSSPYLYLNDDSKKTYSRLLLISTPGNFSGQLQRIRILAREDRQAKAVVKLENLNKKLRVAPESQQEILRFLISEEGSKKQLEQAYIDFPSLLSILDSIKK